ncbi:MAG TPA: hypothetical protein VJH92_06540 [Candidatus Nanoarchaeia archaeon]|nr:hypothetical protein [Candidatus Nanoarchaeia archaeon]
MADNILQHEALTDFVYPFLLVFFIVFAILEKTRVLTDDKKQINAFTAFVIGLIFVAAVNPKIIVTDLVLFLSVAVVIIFVVLLLWGFMSGGQANFSAPGPVKWIVGILIIIAVTIFLFISTGISDDVYGWLFKSDWSGDVWSNIIFVVIIAGAMAVVLASKVGGKPE